MRTCGRRFVSLLAACGLMAGLLLSPAEAIGTDESTQQRADALASISLFCGDANGYGLDRVPTRIEGLVMLIRLLGQEEDALACAADTPFTDLTWGGEYVAYAYVTGLTVGTSATTFSPSQEMTAPSYVTLLLRALGYPVKWGEELGVAAGIGMITEDAAVRLSAGFMDRGDMVDLSYAALTCSLSGGEQTLAQKLCDGGVFTWAAGETAGVLGDGVGWTYSLARQGGQEPPETLEAPEAVILDAPYIDQRQEWPTGCESVSAVMALRYWGVDVGVDEFIDEHLPRGNAPYWRDGALWGCDPWKAFPGDPRSKNGWGCFPPVIVEALESYLAQQPELSFSVVSLEGESLDSLCETYVGRGIPVIVWATSGMEEPRQGKTFYLEDTGEAYTWLSPLHCLLLVGWDNELYYFNDPLVKKGAAYGREAAQRAYEGMGSLAVVVAPKE